MEKVLRFLEKLIPKKIYEWGQPIYHFGLAFLGALIYGFPSRKLYVIGVTGTKGKTTTCNLIYHFLDSYGFKTGLLTTVNFKINKQEWPNTTKQTMLGRFGLQKWLKRMAKEGCEYAVVETSSEGILQFRHRFIDYNMAVFTNITPEHIERHKGFENYRAAKVKLFDKVAKRKDGVGIYNLDDENVSIFLEPRITKRIGYSIKNNFQFSISNFQSIFNVSNVQLFSDRSEFNVFETYFVSSLLGEFNVYNAAAAIAVAAELKIPITDIKNYLLDFKGVPGRMEMIKADGGFTVVVDYAHEPASLEAVYETARGQMLDVDGKLIGVLGAQGGGRDKWKRKIMGEIAARYCDFVILTNEDPYDEDPYRILADIKSGMSDVLNLATKQEFSISNAFEVIDRKEAIKRALLLAHSGDTVVLTGKGGEVWMCVENGKKIPWNEKEVVEELLKII